MHLFSEQFTLYAGVFALNLRVAPYIGQRNMPDDKAKRARCDCLHPRDTVDASRRAMQTFFQRRHAGNLNGDRAVVCLTRFEGGGIDLAIRVNLVVNNAPVEFIRVSNLHKGKQYIIRHCRGALQGREPYRLIHRLSPRIFGSLPRQ